MENEKAPVVPNAELLDEIIGKLQIGLVKKISWLDHAFGRAERLVRTNPNGRKFYTPNVYAGGNEYKELSPDSTVGNFCFFWVDDPQGVTWNLNQSVGISTGFSIIFWFDYRRIFGNNEVRNKEALKREILNVLNNGILLKSGRVEITKIWELAENIYNGFSLDEIDNQFLMHPFGGFRFEGKLSIGTQCLQ